MVVRMMKLPTKALKPALAPNWIAPKAVHRTAHKTVAWIGHDSFSLTWEKYLEKGVASSRANTQNERPTIYLESVRNNLHEDCFDIP